MNQYPQHGWDDIPSRQRTAADVEIINGDGDCRSHNLNNPLPAEPAFPPKVDFELPPSRQEYADQMAAKGWHKIKIT